MGAAPGHRSHGSALIAVLAREPEAPGLLDRIAVEDDLVISAGTLLEALVALQACYGKGRHPAAPNLGDLQAYALAKAHGAPLLHVGADLARRDVAAA